MHVHTYTSYIYVHKHVYPLRIDGVCMYMHDVNSNHRQDNYGRCVNRCTQHYYNTYIPAMVSVDPQLKANLKNYKQQQHRDMYIQVES